MEIDKPIYYDITIIGGGIVGLSTALHLLQKNASLQILVLEKENEIAKHQTGNNSGVIHSGIYYKPNSLRAVNCLRGYQMLLDFCDAEKIPYDICGKIIVATKEDELQRLQNIYQRGIENGLIGLELLDEKAIQQHEPHCAGIKGIYVPQTGIIDYTSVSKKYAEKIKTLNGSISLNQKVVDIKNNSKEIKVITQDNTYTTKQLINCAGLYSDKIATLTNNNIAVKIVPFRGEYFTLKKEKEYLVKNLIYPVPDPDFPFLGVHFTRFIQGGVEAGPNAVLAYAREGYKKSDIVWSEFFESIFYKGFIKLAFKNWRTGFGEMHRSYSKKAFTTALQRLIPELQMDDLVTGEAGVRASAMNKNGNVVDDFIIEQQDNIIHVLNTPSPAATASLSIGLTIAEMALKELK
ncbi:MAG TPA: L-2-hydroxyglutarate oxidase [Chitinophagales bacterium]|nr:L-2-hydroxyglutarate oxidase [Chitinophagales bacterium]